MKDDPMIGVIMLVIMIYALALTMIVGSKLDALEGVRRRLSTPG